VGRLIITMVQGGNPQIRQHVRVGDVEAGPLRVAQRFRGCRPVTASGGRNADQELFEAPDAGRILG
jgi:hypothetical protein